MNVHLISVLSLFIRDGLVSHCPLIDFDLKHSPATTKRLIRWGMEWITGLGMLYETNNGYHIVGFQPMIPAQYDCTLKLAIEEGIDRMVLDAWKRLGFTGIRLTPKLKGPMDYTFIRLWGLTENGPVSKPHYKIFLKLFPLLKTELEDSRRFIDGECYLKGYYNSKAIVKGIVTDPAVTINPKDVIEIGEEGETETKEDFYA